MSFEYLSLAGAFMLGALHALEPGHGKSIVAAYLIGSKGTIKDASVLGITVALAHTMSVIALGVFATLASTYYVYGRVEHALELASGLLIIGIGVWMLIQRTAILRNQHNRSQHLLNRGHNHYSEHREDGRVGRAGLLSLGVAGGIVPCPTALAILLLAVSMGEFMEGLMVVLALSLGLAVALVGIGILACKTSFSLIKYISPESRVTRLMPVLSASIVTLLGVILTVKAVIGFDF